MPQSQEEITQIVSWYLSREYGNSVQVNYNDIARPSVAEKYAQELEQMKKEDTLLPAVYVDDQLVGMGYVDYFSISRALQDSRKGKLADS